MILQFRFEYVAWHNTWEDMNKCLTPDTELPTHQREDITKVLLDEPVSFIRVAYKNTGMWLLTEAELTQRELNYQSPPQLKTWTEAQTCKWFKRLDSGVLPRCISCSGPLEGSSAGLSSPYWLYMLGKRRAW